MLENHVTEYKEKQIICQTCNGSGSIKVTPEEVFEIMEHTTIEHALRVYRQWRGLDGEIDCCDCDAVGEFTVRY